MIDLITILLPAICIGILIALTHAPLGVEVLKRGIIFIDLAIAQIAGLGFILAKMYLGSESSILQQICALAFALAGALAFRKFEKSHPENLEALIGVSFILAASLSILALSNNPHGNEQLHQLLSGQILFTTWTDIMWHTPVYLAIVALWLTAPKVKQGLWFYSLFAVAITSSVQLVGVYVVFASLILPALAVVKLPENKKLFSAWGTGIIAVVLGIAVSAMSDLASGAMIVCSYTLVSYVIYKFTAQKKLH